MVRFGGPKWIPKGGFPRFRRRRRPMAWVANGLETPTDLGLGAATASSLYVDIDAPLLDGTNCLQNKVVSWAPDTCNTQFLGSVLTTYDSHVVETRDLQSRNQSDALGALLRLHRVQGFVHVDVPQGIMPDGGLLDFAWILTIQTSYSDESIDQIDYPDPTLWRSNQMVHSEFGALHSPPVMGVYQGPWSSSRNWNLTMSRRMRKEQSLSLWLYVGSGVPNGGSVNVKWALRALVSR